MTRKSVLIAINKNMLWKETSRVLKLARMKNSLEDYNLIAGPIIELYRKIELNVYSSGKVYKREDYRKMIEEMIEELSKV